MTSLSDTNKIPTIVLGSVLTCTLLIQACNARAPEEAVTAVNISTTNSASISSDGLQDVATTGNTNSQTTELNDQSGLNGLTRSPMISLENYESIVATAFGFINGRNLSSVVIDYHRVMPQTIAFWHSREQETKDYASLLGKSYNCDNGGNVATGLGELGIVYTFDTCVLPTINAVVHHGAVETSLLVGDFNNRYDNLQTINHDGTLNSQLTGLIDEVLPIHSLCSQSTHFRREYENLFYTQPQGNYTATNATIEFNLASARFSESECPSYVDATFLLDFKTANSGTEDFTIQVSTPNAFSGLSGAISEGTLLIEAVDGSSVQLDVNEDGSEMITFTVSNSQRLDSIVRTKAVLLKQLTP